MAAAVVDTAYLSASYSIPENTLQSLLDAPTVELVNSVLLQLSAKAQEYDSIKAEKLRSDVQLEAAVRGGETRASQLKESVNKGLKQIEDLRLQLNEAGTFSGD
jgi:nucleoprotein TPR